MSVHNHLRRQGLLLLTLTSAAVVWASCAELGQAPVDMAPDSGVIIPGLIVSNAVRASGISTTSVNSAQDEVAYVSMPSGALTGVLSVRIRNLTTNGAPSEIIPVIDGGFDPVAVVARPRDQLELTMSLDSGTIAVSYLSVPLRRPPRIVRTVPAKGRTDVALNTRPIIVFSEPIDARTLNAATIQLLAGGIAVSGTIATVSGDALLAEFTPSAPLTQNTDYELLITTGVRDLEGDPLESSERIPFTTRVDVVPPSVAYLMLSRLPELVYPRLQFALTATVIGDNGRVLTDRMVSWSSSNESVALAQLPVGGTAIGMGLVFVTGMGTATITASSEGRSASITLTSPDNLPVSSALEIAAVSMVEYQHPTLTGQWYYAPRLRVKEAAGRTGVAIVGAQFDIPGIGVTNYCTTDRPVAAGQTMDVFGDRNFYGDMDVEFNRWGARATAPEASGIIYIRDANGHLGHIRVLLPIETGSYPATYNAGAKVSWSC